MMNLAKIKTIAYWLTTGFLGILGIWKWLGGLALLAPGMPWLKEWAYAGVFFDLTSAALSHAASGDGAAQVVALLVVGVFAAASYLFRPESALLVVAESERTKAAERDLAA
jgi:DoxX-like family